MVEYGSWFVGRMESLFFNYSNSEQSERVDPVKAVTVGQFWLIKKKHAKIMHRRIQVDRSKERYHLKYQS